MSHFDVFNGDADGLCSLQQLRRDAPRESVLVTGAKRDIALLQRVAAQRGDSVTALDISVDSNRDALQALLERGVSVQYFDHHHAGNLPAHPGLQAHIDPSPGVCTGIIVDRYLEGRQRIWAVVAAFGDNLDEAATRLAAPLALAPAQLTALRELGEGLTYNAYGDREDDLIIHPVELYRSLSRYADPFRFLRREAIFERISQERRGDLEMARSVQPELVLDGGTIYILPAATWSRRVRGVFGNELARRSAGVAHAILTPNAEGGYVVSVRAPLATGRGADALCRQFASGGGRSSAAGINHLPRDQLPNFVREFDRAFR